MTKIKKPVIREARPSDLLSIMYLTREFVRDMNRRGLYHWNTYYPNMQIFEEDIKENKLYIVKDSGFIVAYFVLDKEQPKVYKSVQWSSDEASAGCIRRLAFHPRWKDSGLENEVVKLIVETSKKKGLKSIRFDIPQNDEYESTIFKDSFQEKGEVTLDFQKTPFVCYEKIL